MNNLTSVYFPMTHKYEILKNKTARLTTECLISSEDWTEGWNGEMCKKGEGKGRESEVYIK